MALAVAALLTVVEVRLAETDVLRSLELQTLDWRFRLRGPLPPGGETVLVMIDDASVARLGAWPAPRRAIAAAVRRLAEAGARVIVLDLLFAEPQEPLPTTLRPLLEAALAALPPEVADVRRRIEALLADGGPDRELAAAIAAAGRVIMPYAFVTDPRQANLIAVPPWMEATAYRVRTTIGPGGDEPAALAPAGLLVPAPVLAVAAASSGHVSLVLDSDGSLRAELPAVAYGSELYPSLPVEAVRTFLGLGREQVALDAEHGVRIGEWHLPLDESWRHLVDHLGPQGTIPTYSLVDLLEGRVAREALADRIVVLGASAAGAGDRFATPFTARLPGAEFLAVAIDDILHGRALLRTEAVRGLDTAAIAGLSLAAAFLAGRRSPLVSLGAILLVLLSWWVILQGAFVSAELWLAALTPSAAALASGAGVEAIRLAEERRRRRRLERQRANLARYFAPPVVERLAASDAPAALDRTQEAAVMFVDLVGFTRLAEAMSPATAMNLLRAFHTKVEEAVFAHRGMVDKFIGDGALACFGVPDPAPTAAADALLAAFALLDALAVPVAADAGEVRLTAAIGIHHGPVLMGDIGGATQFQFTVVGDTVNVASRLEALTRQAETALIVSNAALEAARSHLEPSLLARLEPLPSLRLKGREGIVDGWRLVR
ncbi:CHASE2 domain-containing protein [Benzoatithermus flavus]|uniref:Adenylate/guanylate cyclase domain-containing protein n=1 Tax=Benzoatithermus flavus TaxID=3108223 RepID=A0ABU8XW40_9PROT